MHQLFRPASKARSADSEETFDGDVCAELVAAAVQEVNLDQLTVVLTTVDFTSVFLHAVLSCGGSIFLKVKYFSVQGT